MLWCNHGGGGGIFQKKRDYFESGMNTETVILRVFLFLANQKKKPNYICASRVSRMYRKGWALISFSDICVPVCHCNGGYALTIPPPRTLPSYPRTQYPPCPLSQVTTIGGGLPPLNHGCAVATPTIGARQRRLCLSSCSPLPVPYSAEPSHPASHPHNTFACHHTSLPPPPRQHPCTP